MLLFCCLLPQYDKHEADNNQACFSPSVGKEATEEERIESPLHQKVKMSRVRQKEERRKGQGIEERCESLKC